MPNTSLNYVYNRFALFLTNSPLSIRLSRFGDARNMISSNLGGCQFWEALGTSSRFFVTFGTFPRESWYSSRFPNWHVDLLCAGLPFYSLCVCSFFWFPCILLVAPFSFCLFFFSEIFEPLKNIRKCRISRGWLGAGMGVGMLRVGRDSFIENKNQSFKVANFQSLIVATVQNNWNIQKHAECVGRPSPTL